LAAVKIPETFVILPKTSSAVFSAKCPEQRLQEPLKIPYYEFYLDFNPKE